MYKYCVYGIREKDRFINFICSFEDFSEAEECLHSCYTTRIYNYDGYIIKYEWVDVL